MAVCRKLPIVNGSSPCGRITSLTSRGFGVVATIDTVVRGTSGFKSFIRVKFKPLSDDFLLVLLRVADLNLACGRVDQSIHGLLKGRSLLNNVIANELKC